MRAIVYREYGSPDVLQYEEIDRPRAAEDEVLVSVRAASVNPRDWVFMRGTPYMVRLMSGLRAPKTPCLGVDLAGVVEDVGRSVKAFQPGDEVFGARVGAFAEYVCARESQLARKPATLTFEQAAAMPTAGLTALQSLRDRARVRFGETVLINGAAGGVGTFAVPIAKSLGAIVTGVCSTRNVELVRSIGADRVIDYSREDFTSGAERYDVIVDCVSNRPLSACRRVLNANGTYVLVGGTGGRWIGPAARGLHATLLSRVVSQKLLMFLTRPSKDDLLTLKALAEAGAVKPVIDRRYTLRELPDAIRYLEGKHARGKVCITL